jgi:hypothetical protein
MNGDGNGPKIPIPGAAGAALFVALQRMATHCGEVELTIKKERVAGGGYAYVISNHQPPARPVTRS